MSFWSFHQSLDAWSIFILFFHLNLNHTAIVHLKITCRVMEGSHVIPPQSPSSNWNSVQESADIFWRRWDEASLRVPLILFIFIIPYYLANLPRHSSSLSSSSSSIPLYNLLRTLRTSFRLPRHHSPIPSRSFRYVPKIYDPSSSSSPFFHFPNYFFIHQNQRQRRPKGWGRMKYCLVFPPIPVRSWKTQTIIELWAREPFDLSPSFRTFSISNSPRQHLFSANIFMCFTWSKATKHGQNNWVSFSFFHKSAYFWVLCPRNDKFWDSVKSMNEQDSDDVF